MQWKSFFFISTAHLALARHRRYPLHPDVHVKAAHKARQLIDLDSVHTIFDIEIVTITDPIPPAPTTFPTVGETDEKNTLPIIGANLKVNLDPNNLNILPHATTTRQPPITTDSPTPWTAKPSNQQFSTQGFGARSDPSGTGVQYAGNVGVPWGSNIMEVDVSTAWQYKYVAQFRGSNSPTAGPWTVVIWNKIGRDGKMTGWYGHSAVNFTLGPRETRYVAFDGNSQGAWGAAKGDSLPRDQFGGYSCTWGEFDFGDEKNGLWSGWDVSAIQAQNARQTVQGMSICAHDGSKCSSITTGAAVVENAYTSSEATVDGIGGAVPDGPVRLVVQVDYN
ncbi:hypothetical protein EYZ11_003953 [Aspergillus tanneri]|uniref:Allergen Asp f 4 n=1 Tax=Aspergillus tanneri TaxID=1220188 RepID=A0A4S3JSM1_9EURO|nr:uncharacterized protein ATNIH1004_010952 [Aspergillus tanneri]KAA8642012.1 hypothetical protein ATNIH1004_010952 [Aspergillus tanneri]THC96561.1 hypothetical protein EYZ11_003953 [Aspergillus tanneri]